MAEGFEIWKLLAGLGIFLFGMFLMEESIKKLSGKSFKRFIREYTTGKIKSALSGIFSTAIIVNRVFAQSARQLRMATKDLLLSNQEVELFDNVQDITESISVD